LLAYASMLARARVARTMPGTSRFTAGIVIGNLPGVEGSNLSYVSRAVRKPGTAARVGAEC
jgi:hypothetical protein